MIDEKYQALAALVREARIQDAQTFAALDRAQAEWKAANKTLTDRIGVLNGYATQIFNEATAIDRVTA